MYNNEEYDEILILSIIYKHNIKIMSLQIIDRMFIKEINKRILEIFRKLYKEHKRIELGEMFNYLNKGYEIDVLTEIVTNDSYDEVHYEEEFIDAQKRILKRYKVSMIDELTLKLKNKKVSLEEYTEKVNKINSLKIENNDYIITLETLNKEIYSNNTKIKFNRFKKVETYLNLSQNDLLVIGAGTGVGKSALLLNLMEDLSNNYQCIYFNLEMAPRVLLRRLIGIFGNVPMEAIDNSETEYQKGVVEKAKDEIIKRKLLLINKKNTIQDIRVSVAQNKEKNKHTIILIDHIGLIKSKDKKSLYEQATETAQELRQISLEFDCTIICASQLNRDAYKEEVPTLRMLKDSGEVENSSRKALLLYRNPEDKEKKEDTLDPILNLQIVKNDDGVYKTITLKYEKIKQKMEEINKY